MSLSVLERTQALFSCTGIGITITWQVDGLSLYDSDIVNRGITIVLSSGTVQLIHTHCTRNISEQWHHCTMCSHFVYVWCTVGGQQLLYLDCISGLGALWD